MPTLQTSTAAAAAAATTMFCTARKEKRLNGATRGVTNFLMPEEAKEVENESAAESEVRSKESWKVE